MITTFGILVNALDVSQTGVMILTELNKLVSKEIYVNPVVFYKEYYQSFTQPKFSCMLDVEAWTFPHPVIATNLASAKLLANLPCCKRKLFYVMDLEWILRNPTTSFNSKDLLYKDLQLYTHPEIELIARSKKHAQLIEECWKKPIATIENFNYQEILNVIRKTKTNK